MKQLLWIGTWEDDREFAFKAQKGAGLASAQTSQKNLILGIEQGCGLKFDSINGSILPPYPVYQDHIVPKVVWNHTEGARDVSVGYRNDKYINRYFCKRAMIAEADRWIEERYRGGELIMMVYSMRSCSMATACHIKKRIPDARTYLIVTDLPQYMDLGQSRVKAFLKKIDWISIQRMQREFDGFVLYASPMAEFLKIPRDRWLLMEGSYNCEEAPQSRTDRGEKRALMYSGILDKQYGIHLLLDAFMQVEGEDYELWLTGRGNAEEYIRQCEKRDPRIRFFGFLPSRTDVLKLQQEATAMMNMRLPSEPASAYCFPSKLFEYMATGKPVLSFRLEGIPKEYDPYLMWIEQENLPCLQEAIQRALSMDDEEQVKRGAEAARFVAEQKNVRVQAGKIIAFAEMNSSNSGSR